MQENMLLQHLEELRPVLSQRQGCLLEGVPLARGAFSRDKTDLVLRPGVRVFVEEDLEYRGTVPGLGDCLGAVESGWRELYLPTPTDDLEEALEQVESLLGGTMPPVRDADGAVPQADRFIQEEEDAGLGGGLEEPPARGANEMAPLGARAPQATPHQGDLPAPPARRRAPFSVPRAIQPFVRDLTELAARGELGQVVGREKETDSLLVVLGKREVPNAVLVGPPGVGKSAVAYRLALRLVEGSVPEALADAHLLELNCGDLVAGASFKGEVERLVEACSDPRIILFVDEFHNLLEARGDVKVIEMLKPALARGGIRVLGACTPKDYRSIEMDGTLARRFEKLVVGEPSGEETIRILTGLQPDLERHHGVRIPPGAIQEAVYLSEQFLPNRYQPEKAVKLLDEALSRLRLEKASTHVRQSSAEELEAELDRAIEVGDIARARRLHEELSKMKESKP
jgi:ATP-dependent Clp protease ATP-binding subunit ClpA